MLTEKTYSLWFADKDTQETTEQEFTRIEDAWTAFRLFAEPRSAEIYTRIELTEYNWDTGESTLIAALEFAKA